MLNNSFEDAHKRILRRLTRNTEAQTNVVRSSFRAAFNKLSELTESPFEKVWKSF